MPERPNLRAAANESLSAWDEKWAAIDDASTKWGPEGTPGQAEAAAAVAKTTSAMDRAMEALRTALAAEATEPPPMCRNGHPFELGVDIDYPDHPDPKWCNVCGEAAGPAPDPQGADEPVWPEGIVSTEAVEAVASAGPKSVRLLAESHERLRALAAQNAALYNQAAIFCLEAETEVKQLRAAAVAAPDEPGDDDFPTTAAVLASLEDIERFHDDADMQTAAGVARLALIGYRDRYAGLLAEVERLRAAAPASEDNERERWRFVVEADTLEGGYVVECLDLPGCVSEGDSVPDALAGIGNAYAAIKGALPVPPGTAVEVREAPT